MAKQKAKTERLSVPAAAQFPLCPGRTARFILPAASTAEGALVCFPQRAAIETADRAASHLLKQKNKALLDAVHLQKEFSAEWV